MNKQMNECGDGQRWRVIESEAQRVLEIPTGRTAPPASLHLSARTSSQLRGLNPGWFSVLGELLKPLIPAALLPPHLDILQLGLRRYVKNPQMVLLAGGVKDLG